MKHIFIVNPTAGKNKTSEIIASIEKVCQLHQVEYQIILTNYPKHATLIASSYQPNDQVTLYCVGGDGTLSEVLNGIHPSLPLALIPCGSGNDFYKMLNLQISSLEQIIEDTLFGNIVKIDCGLANNMRFINCFSTGLDADVAETAHEMLRKNKASKNLAYIKSACKHALKPSIRHLKIMIDNEVIEKDFLLIAIMNGKYYGGGFRPVESPDLQDGMLDVCMIDYIKSSKIFPLLAKFYQGKHTHLDICTIKKAKSIVIESKDLLLMQCDGEAFYTHNITLSCHHHQQSFKIPGNKSNREIK